MYSPAPSSLPCSSQEAGPLLWQWAWAQKLGQEWGQGLGLALWMGPPSPCHQALGSPLWWPWPQSWQPETWFLMLQRKRSLWAGWFGGGTSKLPPTHVLLTRDYGLLHSHWLSLETALKRWVLPCSGTANVFLDARSSPCCLLPSIPTPCPSLPVLLCLISSLLCVSVARLCSPYEGRSQSGPSGTIPNASHFDLNRGLAGIRIPL